ncbi:hypothetical protein BJ912DRAFT_925042 [Pholiota molesta]|nr:hypothetical protein BJ912DRAFT_925042 [Pholiota molesta]
MVATSNFSLVLVAVSTDVMALDFNHRFYENRGYDHNSSGEDTYPLNSLAPLSGSSGVCLSAPTGINWNRLEVDNNLSGEQFGLIMFCNVYCAGDSSGAQTAVLSDPSFACL